MVDADVLELVRAAAAAARDKKAFQVVALDVVELTSLADSFMVCSGASERQVQAIADEVERRLTGEGRRPLHSEGRPRGSWVLLDYGDLVIHVLTEERREYYSLESLWTGAEHLDVAESTEDGPTP